ncbi:MAG TPA: carboxypeptidase-like regulatory domain-containing protein [Vicinamibacterales bacterium]|jgi:hypothetical protein
MKRVLALALVVALVSLGVPTASFAAAPRQANGSIAGIAKDAGGTPLGNYTVRLRNTGTGAISGTTQTSAAGEFSFASLPTGNYVVEITDSTGKIIATSSALNLGAGATLTGVAVAASAAGAAAAAAAVGGGAGAFFTSTAGILILVAAGAGTVAAIVATRGDSSPKK